MLDFSKVYLLLITSIISFIWTLRLSLINTNKKLDKKQKKLYTTYYLHSASFILWSLSNAYFQSPLLIYFDEQVAIYMAQLANMACSFGIFFAFYLSYLFLPHKDRFIKLAFHYYLVQGLLLVLVQVLNVIPGLTVLNVEIKGISEFTLINGPITPFYFGLGVIFIFWTLVNFIKSFNTSIKINQERIRYMILGISFTLVSILIFDIIIPAYNNDYSLVWLPPVFSVIEIILFGYALMAIHFYSMRLLIHKVLVYGVTFFSYLFLLFHIDKYFHIQDSTTILPIILFLILSIIVSINYVVKFWSYLLNIIFHYKGEALKDNIQFSVSNGSEEKPNQVSTSMDDKIKRYKDKFVALAGNLAHEVRNSLNVIAAVNQKSKDDISKYPHQTTQLQQSLLANSQKIDRVIESCSNITKLLLQNLKNEKIDASNFELLSITSEVKDALAEYPFQDHQQEKVSLSIINDFYFLGSKPLFRNVIHNLLNNALYYFKQKPSATVSIRIDSTPEANILYFKDTGVGIPPEKIPTLFHDFMTSNKKGGTGLGLSFCARVIESFQAYYMPIGTQRIHPISTHISINRKKGDSPKRNPYTSCKQSNHLYTRR